MPAGFGHPPRPTAGTYIRIASGLSETMTILRCDWKDSTHRRFERLDRPALQWNPCETPVNLSLLLAILHAPISSEEEALLRRLFLVRMLERESTQSDASSLA